MGKTGRDLTVKNKVADGVYKRNLGKRILCVVKIAKIGMDMHFKK